MEKPKSNLTCPYDSKVDACLYLEKITPTNKEYYCDKCPHYNPQGYYDKDPKYEGFMIAVAAVCIASLLVMLAAWGIFNLAKWIASWF